MTILTDELLKQLEDTIVSFDVQNDDDTYTVCMCGSGCADCSAACENSCTDSSY